MTLKEILKSKFVFIDEVAEIIQIGFETNKNVFLYGRGGHAKSQIAEEVLKYIDPVGSNSYVLSCGEGLTEEKLFGGIDLRKFNTTGELEYLVHNSFMNFKYVVFEELLDSRMNVLLSLKDILTSRMFRQGKQSFNIKTQFVICLTNRTKQEVAEDNSIKALMERFPLECKVEWHDYSSDSYRKMFSKIFQGKEYPDIADLCQIVNKSGEFISPRTAVHMAQVYDKFGDKALKYFGVGSDIIKDMATAKQNKADIENLKYFKQTIEKEWANADSKEGYIKVYKNTISTLSVINEKTYDDTVFSFYKEVEEKLKAIKQATESKLLKYLIE